MARRTRARRGIIPRNPARHTRSSNVNGITDAFDVWHYDRALERRQPLRRFREFIGIPELRNEILQYLDQRSIVAFRGGTDRSIRDLVARPACQNCRNRKITPHGRYTNQMPNPNPFSESTRPAGQLAQCTRDGSVAVGARPQHMQRCVGKLYLQAPDTPAHGRDHWVCQGCAKHAWRQYDHTRYPPWFHGLCLPCSYVAYDPNAPVCRCRRRFNPGGGCWLCSDCWRQLGLANYIEMMQEAHRSLRPRRRSHDRTDMRRYIRHATSTRQRCARPCNLPWQRVLVSYPPAPNTPTGRDLTFMFRRCLFCKLDCSTLTQEPN